MIPSYCRNQELQYREYPIAHYCYGLLSSAPYVLYPYTRCNLHHLTLHMIMCIDCCSWRVVLVVHLLLNTVTFEEVSTGLFRRVLWLRLNRIFLLCKKVLGYLILWFGRSRFMSLNYNVISISTREHLYGISVSCMCVLWYCWKLCSFIWVIGSSVKVRSSSSLVFEYVGDCPSE